MDKRLQEFAEGKIEKERLTYEDYVKLDVASEIWNICAISPEHGNAVMDIIGEEAYQRVMDLVRQREEMVNRWVNDFFEKEANNGNVKEV